MHKKLNIQIKKLKNYNSNQYVTNYHSYELSGHSDRRTKRAQ